ncbi:MAG: RNA polymerase sigma factor [Lentisphaeria bacterium]
MTIPIIERAAGMVHSVAADKSLSYEKFSDLELVVKMNEGDTAAFEEIFVRYETRLVAYATRYMGSIDAAKDICQEAFLKLIRKPPVYLAHNNLAPWLFRITRNLSIDKQRRGKFEIAGRSDEFPEAKEEKNPLSTLSKRNDVAIVRQLVNELPHDLREVVELRIDGNVPFKDIAEILDIPHGTALWRMHRAVQVLRDQWRHYDPDM